MFVDSPQVLEKKTVNGTVSPLLDHFTKIQNVWLIALKQTIVLWRQLKITKKPKEYVKELLWQKQMELIMCYQHQL